MGEDEDQRSAVREAFRRLYVADRERGEAREVDAYKKPFPGYGDVIDEEYRELRARADTVRAGRAETAAGGGAGPRDAAATPPREGHIGPYRILRELGRGGMGVVYEAQDTRLPRRVALKVLSPQFSLSAPLRLRFQREAAIASMLDHPNLCTVYEAGEDDGTPYMAMRYLEGKPLSEWIGQTRDGGRASGIVALPPAGGMAPEVDGGTTGQREDLDRILLLMERVARALHEAHEKGLIHRDVKPQNIIVKSDGEPVLLDFGLAREEAGEGHGLTRTGSLMGTPAYLSPEQLAAQRIHLDRRTDVYSLGVSLYECLTLRLPFEAPTLDGLYQKILMTEPVEPRTLNGAIPKDLQVVVSTAIDRNRDRRYQTALALAEDLRRVRSGEPILARPPGLLVRLQRWRATSAGGLSETAVIALGVLSLFRGCNRHFDVREARRELAAVERDRDALAAEFVKAKALQGRELEGERRTARALRQRALLVTADALRASHPETAVLLAAVATRMEGTRAATDCLAACLAAAGMREAADGGPWGVEDAARLLEMAHRHVPRELTPEERERYGALLAEPQE